MHGGADFFGDGKVAVGGDDFLVFSRLGKHLAPGVDDGGIAAVLGIPCPAAGVAAGKVHLVLDGPGLGEHPQMGHPHIRPLGHHEQKLQAGNGHGPGELRETDVVADENSHIMPVHPEPADVISLCEIVVLSHGGKQVGLVVPGQQLPLTVEDAGGVVNRTPAEAGHGTGHDIDAQFLCQSAHVAFNPGAVRVRQRFQIFLGEEAHIP